MTPRERMLAASRGELPDTVPIAPEFWSYIPARVLGLDMIEFNKVPHWKALHKTFRHYGTEGRGCVGVHPPVEGLSTTQEERKVEDGRTEVRTVIRTPHGEMTRRSQMDGKEPPWTLERQVKDIERDWPAYEYSKIGGDIDAIKWQPVRDALAEVGEDYLLEVRLPLMFTDFIGVGRDGGLEQLIFDLVEREDFFRAVQERYLDYTRRFTEAACRNSGGEVYFIGARWSCASLLGPNMWRKWDKPMVAAAVEVAHRHGKLVHIHFHGKCMEVLEDLLECGLDSICPFERPPGGDVTDLGEVRRILGDSVTVRGNVHTIETLIRGRPEDVRKQVRGIFEQWGPDKRRLILGTGDQVGGETPDENIHAMVEAGREFGRCP